MYLKELKSKDRFMMLTEITNKQTKKKNINKKIKALLTKCFMINANSQSFLQLGKSFKDCFVGTNHSNKCPKMIFTYIC